jgi:hypothetical protein
MWPALAHSLGVEPGPDEPMSMAEYFSGRERLWQQIVERYDLQPIPLSQLIGESHHYADLCFAYGTDEPPSPAFVSTVKIKQAGFGEVCNTEESFCYWLEDLQKRRVIPRFQPSD